MRLTYTPDQIAAVVHAANRELQRIQGDDARSDEWDCTSYETQQACIAGVMSALSGVTAEEHHEAWRTYMIATGWSYGPYKSEIAKTHPCMVDYAELPPGQQDKNVVFLAIVAALAAHVDIREYTGHL